MPGRSGWPSRDPLEEDGGSNLYAFVGNNPISAIDLFGLKVPQPIPPYNPPDLGKPCCCSDPTSITAQRTDSAPTKNWLPWPLWQWTFHYSVALTIKKTCYKDLEIQWTTCYRGSNAGYVGSGFSVDVSLPVGVPVPGIGNIWVTDARVFYLACEGGKWTKKRLDASLGYAWDGWNWSH